MTPTQAHGHFCDMIQKLRNMEPSPWPFLCAAAMLDYLAKMAIGSGRSAYKQFIRQHMKQEYRDFQFANGDKDLPEQLYHVLRCGVVHSFSLTPDVAQYPNGRNESIIIAHEGHHLARYSGADGHHPDAVCLVFKDFVDDIEGALTKLFSDAQTDTALLARIHQHLKSNPPVVGLPRAAVPLTFRSSTFTPAASGSTHL